ncbi:MAG: hypothetical protein NTV00_10015 [Methylococcales bacterium]|nr:hypothetical protein [Methylococcales bacterium]
MPMKYTQYFEVMRQRPDRADIQLEWIARVVEFPIKDVTQEDGRIRRWAAMENICGLSYLLMARQYIMLFLIGHLPHEN